MSKMRAKMPIEVRAKQFMPFSAVSGLDEALEKKLKEYQEKQKNTTEDPTFSDESEE